MYNYQTPLSNRETEVLKWLCMGKTNWEIGVILDISLYTVKNHVKNILKKLGVNNRTHAAKIALSEHLVEM